MPIKLPTEKDLLGRECPTPDCEGEVCRIDIYDQAGEVHTIEGRQQRVTDQRVNLT